MNGNIREDKEEEMTFIGRNENKKSKRQYVK